MTASIGVVPKKRGRPATGRDPVTAIRLSEEFREAVDRAISDNAQPLSRSEYIRRVLGDHLRAKGYLPAAGDPEATT